MSEELTPAPSDVVELYEGCIYYVEKALNVQLDFTQETLPLLDHYVRTAPDNPSQEVLGLMVPICGAYFGEVVRRQLPGGRWHAPEEDYSNWRVEFDPCFLHFNPL